MAIIPRRHRSLVYKLLILIPVVWLTVAFLLYSDRGGAGDYHEEPASLRGGRRDLNAHLSGSGARGSGSGGRNINDLPLSGPEKDPGLNEVDVQAVKPDDTLIKKPPSSSQSSAER